MVKKMVSEIPSFEEFFGLNKDDLTEDDFAYESSDKDEEYIGIAILMILFNFYKKYQYKPMRYIENNFIKDLSNLELDLNKAFEIHSNTILDKYKDNLLKNDNIPSNFKDKFRLGYNVKETLVTTKSTVTSMINQLKNDVETKILVDRKSVV